MSIKDQPELSRVVVIGSGMAGDRVVDEIRSRSPGRFAITLVGAEAQPPYNRILLSNVLQGKQEARDTLLKPVDWHVQNGVNLLAGFRATRIDRERRVVVVHECSADREPWAEPGVEPAIATHELPYDHVVIATGSRPFVPPIPGLDLGRAGTFVFRTLEDCERIASWASGVERAVVIGGGLLGLEAARGLLTHGVSVCVLEAAPRLMANQVDVEGARVLGAAMARLGVDVRAGVALAQVSESERGRVIRLGDGSEIPADLLVVATGIRPITDVARTSGLGVARGIVCDDQMRTSDPRIFALGECIEHRGTLFGLVEPIWEQARVVADVLTGVAPEASYGGSKVATRLKVMGVDLAVLGDAREAAPDDEVVTFGEPARGVYQRLVIRAGRLTGAVLIGDTTAFPVLDRLYRLDELVPETRAELLFPAGASLAFDAATLSDEDQVCNCNGVSAGAIRQAIAGGACTVPRIAACTRAGGGCGSCRGTVAALLDLAGGPREDESEHWYVPGVPLRKAELTAAIRERGLRSVSSVFRAFAAGREDAASKPGLASLLRSIWNEAYEDERDARYVNDRVHANIQRDGTFSVVPRIYGGVTSPAELRRIADVAERYGAAMVKITGGQRIDLLGIRREDLPGVWRDLGMPSGHAYTKAFRTCKSCVGSDFCRYGIGDAVALAQQIERRFQGVESPAKMKLATAGCPRNCSEAYVKDVGLVAVEGGNWEVYVGGAAGAHVRKGDLLCTVRSHDEALGIVGRFMQYYRENARWLERTYAFVPRLGIEHLRRVLIEDSEGICARLDREMDATALAYVDPWAADTEAPAYPGQFDARPPLLVAGAIA